MLLAKAWPTILSFRFVACFAAAAKPFPYVEVESAGAAMH